MEEISIDFIKERGITSLFTKDVSQKHFKVAENVTNDFKKMLSHLYELYEMRFNGEKGLEKVIQDTKEYLKNRADSIIEVKGMDLISGKKIN